uniref:Uncharacterized protein n=1 Tax=Arundo donax TaxID=35708 RepID=A0A0A9AKY6_ARUDO
MSGCTSINTFVLIDLGNL